MKHLFIISLALVLVTWNLGYQKSYEVQLYNTHAQSKSNKATLDDLILINMECKAIKAEIDVIDRTTELKKFFQNQPFVIIR